MTTMPTEPRSLSPDGYEKALAAVALLMLGIVLVALIRGAAHWGDVPGFVWGHLATVLVALVLTPIMLQRPRGTATHRYLGRVWMLAMFSTAVISLFVRQTHPGHFSIIHILSVVVIIAVPRAIWAAKTHRISQHRTSIRGIVTGSLIIAGIFTFPFGRMLGVWLSGG